MSLPDDLLSRSANEAARRIALHFLDEADAASERLPDPHDTEALHDFRVAIRRLRSHARAHSKQLRGALDKKQRRKLRELQRSTGGARDLEVQLTWIRGFESKLELADRAGYDAVCVDLEKRRAQAGDGVESKVRRRFRKAGTRLRVPLTKVSVDLTQEPATYAQVLAAGMREHMEVLVSLTAAIGAIADEEAIHDARIAGKRLRYLVEPVRTMTSGAKKIVKKLKSFQDLLGDIHDMQVLVEELEGALESSTDETRPGIEKLRGLSQAHAEDLFARLQRSWLASDMDELGAQVEALANELAPAEIEVERKYLLRSLPPVVVEHPSKELRQGYVPGESVHERIREVKGAEQTKYTRTVKLGRGVQRFEFEEETTAPLFQTMWPLTEGSRVHKRRYSVMHEGHEWVVDEFLDRSLVLAEIELDSRHDEVTLPPWLEPFVEREVTDDPTYLNLNLAK